MQVTITYLFIYGVTPVSNTTLSFMIGMLFLLSNPRDIPVDDMVAEQDVVIVTLSYRVNAFGFYCYEHALMPGIKYFERPTFW